VSGRGSARCKCDFSKEDFLDRTALNDDIFNCVGLEMISIYLSFGFTKGKHLSWLVFLGIAGITYYAALNG